MNLSVRNHYTHRYTIICNTILTLGYITVDFFIWHYVPKCWMPSFWFNNDITKMNKLLCHLKKTARYKNEQLFHKFRKNYSYCHFLSPDISFKISSSENISFPHCFYSFLCDFLQQKGTKTSIGSKVNWYSVLKSN